LPDHGERRTARAPRRSAARVAETARSSIDSDGCLRVASLLIRPSDLWTPEFKRFYMRRLDQLSGPLPFPSRAAPKAEWDKFDAWIDKHLNVEPLAWLENRYSVDIVETTMAGVRVGIVSPREGIASENRQRALINLHGGGFVMNRGLMFGLMESIPVAAIGRIKVITLDYRQAPFAVYPAASEDVAAVYEELLGQYRPEALGIFGCSAGGILTAQAVAWFQAKGLPRPGAVGIFSIGVPPPYAADAWGNGWGDSAIWFSSLPSSDYDVSGSEPTRWYLEDVDSNDVVAFPGRSDSVLSKFPPTLYLSGTRDFAMSASVAAHARFLQLSVDSSLYIMEGAPHGAHVLAVDTPEAQHAQAHVARWFCQRLA
jgi:epsilon-lactone hydrolase